MAVCVFSDYFTVKNCLENKKTPWSLSSLSGKVPVFSHHYDVISCRRNLGNLNMESVGALSSQQGGEQIAGEWGAILPFPSVAVTYNYGGTWEPSRAKCGNFVWKRIAFKMTRWSHNSIKSERSLCNVCMALKTHSSFFPTSSRLHCWLLFKVHFSMLVCARQAGLSIYDTDLLGFTKDCPKKRKYPASGTWCQRWQDNINERTTPPALRQCISMLSACLLKWPVSVD